MPTLLDIVRRDPNPTPWGEVSKIPWDDPDFSRRMLAEHLSQAHDAASRRTEIIEQHVAWIHEQALGGRPSRVLDLGCGPGLYANRLAKLGHACAGIDFGPASIDYARETAEHGRTGCAFIQGDLRSTAFPDDNDLIMLIFGEFNVFAPAEALDILTRSRRALRGGGTLLLEVHTHAAVKRMGREPATWKAAERGLFSDEPHIRLDEACWDEDAQVAINRHYVIDAAGGSVALYGASVQAYSRQGYAELLSAAGFERLEWREDWPGIAGGDDFNLLLGTSAGSADQAV
jgi:SAM-dependent methyltransferase